MARTAFALAACVAAAAGVAEEHRDRDRVATPYSSSRVKIGAPSGAAGEWSLAADAVWTVSGAPSTEAGLGAAPLVLPASVPGNAHLALLAAGLLGDEM